MKQYRHLMPSSYEEIAAVGNDQLFPVDPPSAAPQALRTYARGKDLLLLARARLSGTASRNPLFRPPEKGEWYLAGNPVVARRARKDFRPADSRVIAELCLAKPVVKHEVEEDLPVKVRKALRKDLP